MPMMSVTLYSDGSARGEPRPGGYGTVMHYTDTKGKLHVLELSQGYERTTNNRMELLASSPAWRRCGARARCAWCPTHSTW